MNLFCDFRFIVSPYIAHVSFCFEQKILPGGRALKIHAKMHIVILSVYSVFFINIRLFEIKSLTDYLHICMYMKVFPKKLHMNIVMNTGHCL